jgi:hypothetical protein
MNGKTKVFLGVHRGIPADKPVTVFTIEYEAFDWLREAPDCRTVLEIEAVEWHMYADGSGAPWVAE